jgi:hypothetical protein
MNRLLRVSAYGIFCLLINSIMAYCQDISFQRVLPLQGSVNNIKAAIAPITGMTQEPEEYVWIDS